MNASLFFENAGDERGTPQDFFDELNKEFQFDLDAAANERNHKCELYFGPGGIAPDSLIEDWGGDGVSVFHNPPYSIADKFIAKAWAESQKGARVVNLLAARPDTRYWHKYIWDKNAFGCSQAARTFAGDHAGYLPDGDWRPGVRGRFLPGRLDFTLSVPVDLRAWIKSEWTYAVGWIGDAPKDHDLKGKEFTEWVTSMISVTGLPKTAIARILQNKPDNDLLDSAPFPSAVVIFEKVQ